MDVLNFLRERKVETPRQTLSVALSTHLPKRLTSQVCELCKIDGRLGELSDEKLTRVAEQVHQWSVLPSGTEGYRTAEVTLGGVDTDGLSSKTMESKTCPGLYFIGEVVDVAVTWAASIFNGLGRLATSPVVTHNTKIGASNTALTS